MCQSKDDLEAVLDPETGYAPRLRQICQDQCVSLIIFACNRVHGTKIEEFKDYRDGTDEQLEGLRLEEKYMGAYTSSFSVRLLPFLHPVSLLRRCALETEKQNCLPARLPRTSCSRIRIPNFCALSG